MNNVQLLKLFRAHFFSFSLFLSSIASSSPAPATVFIPFDDIELLGFNCTSLFSRENQRAMPGDGKLIRNTELTKSNFVPRFSGFDIDTAKVALSKGDRWIRPSTRKYGIDVEYDSGPVWINSPSPPDHAVHYGVGRKPNQYSDNIGCL